MTSVASSMSIPLFTVASLLFATTTTGATLSAPITQLCGISEAVATKNGQYIFNNNAWGADSSGAQCTYVNENGSSFNSVWSWTQNPDNTHSFPNVQLNSQEILPLLLTDLAAVNVQTSWSMTQDGGLLSNTRANVVVDLFLDPDAKISGNASNAAVEMMIWMGAYDNPFPLGASVSPFGTVNNSLPSVVVSGTNFTLFSGVNSVGQAVHSWVSTTANLTEFSGDVKPLVDYLTSHDLVKNNTYLGLVQFGSETWHATSNVTFTAHNFSLNVTSTNATANAAAASAISSGSSTNGGSSGSSSGVTKSSSAAVINLPSWFWEIAAAGSLFALL